MRQRRDDRPRVCARCGAGAVLDRVESDGTRELLCAEHGYAGSWVTSDDRERRLREYRARGMRPDAILAGAMSMIKRSPAVCTEFVNERSEPVFGSFVATVNPLHGFCHT